VHISSLRLLSSYLNCSLPRQLGSSSLDIVISVIVHNQGVTGTMDRGWIGGGLLLN
jgi:hypothetical protein